MVAKRLILWQSLVSVKRRIVVKKIIAFSLSVARHTAWFVNLLLVREGREGIHVFTVIGGLDQVIDIGIASVIELLFGFIDLFDDSGYFVHSEFS
jgi:hypothetical protein